MTKNSASKTAEAPERHSLSLRIPNHLKAEINAVAQVNNITFTSAAKICLTRGAELIKTELEERKAA